jgi:hypothetical protein
LFNRDTLDYDDGVPYRCPQCGTNQRDYPMLLGFDPRAICAHYSHKGFFDFAFHGVRHIRRAALCGFITGFAVGAYLLWQLLRVR